MENQTLEELKVSIMHRFLLVSCFLLYVFEFLKRLIYYFFSIIEITFQGYAGLYWCS